MNDQPAASKPSLADQPASPLYTEAQLHDYALALVASVTQDIHADLVETLLGQLPLAQCPGTLAHGINRLIPLHPRPRDLIAALLRHLADALAAQ